MSSRRSDVSDADSPGPPQHFVCTHSQARALIEERDRFLIAVCGCRNGQAGCSRSRMDVCLFFNPEFSYGTERRPASKDDALELLTEADTKGLISRPFRNADRPDELDGICFCCPECCHYFRHPEDACDKGSLCECTAVDSCTHCLLCVDSCHFGARRAVDGHLVVDRDRCYGCGLCVDACPAGCIEMTDRIARG